MLRSITALSAEVCGSIEGNWIGLLNVRFFGRARSWLNGSGSNDKDRFEEKEKNYEKMVLLGRSVLVFLALTIGALFWGAGIIREGLPTWMGSGERLISAVMMKAEEILPGAKEKVKEIVPGLAEPVEKVIPGIEIPGKDVGGEDIKPIPRYRNMIRVSYSMENQKKIVSYKGKVDFGAVKEFYRKEMPALGFQEKALRASPAEEVYQFKKRSQNLEFTLRKITVVLSDYTELTIKEL